MAQAANKNIPNNPTAYFFNQAAQVCTDYDEEIKKFVGTLINQKSCVLCKIDYDISNHIPRILVHCGHTFCQCCLLKFYKNSRVRCPLCLKLIKNIDTIDRLPINHTIYTKLIDELNEKNASITGYVVNSQATLYQQFAAASQKQGKMKIKINKNMGRTWYIYILKTQKKKKKEWIYICSKAFFFYSK